MMLVRRSGGGRAGPRRCRQALLHSARGADTGYRRAGGPVLDDAIRTAGVLPLTGFVKAVDSGETGRLRHGAARACAMR